MLRPICPEKWLVKAVETYAILKRVQKKIGKLISCSNFDEFFFACVSDDSKKNNDKKNCQKNNFLQFFREFFHFLRLIEIGAKLNFLSTFFLSKNLGKKVTETCDFFNINK